MIAIDRWQPSGEPPADEVREKMVEIFQRPEFQRTKNPLQRLLEWLAERFGGGSAEAPSGAGWGGPIGSIIGWVVLTLLAAAVVVVLVMIVRRWRPTRRRRTAAVEVSIEDHRTAGEWGRAAEQFESEGAWKEAIRCRYRELVASLVDRGLALPMPGRTTGELRVDISSSMPAVAEQFSEATELFELPWYADRPTGPADNARFRMLATVVLEAAPSAAVDEPELVAAPQ